MPAPTTELAKLQRSFTTPSIEEIQKYSPCAICWADYDEGIMSDTPVKLPCRHVFGEKCILKWAKGKTPSGYRNGCPLCHADLLPQSLWTNLRSWVRSKLEEHYIFFMAHPPTDELHGGRMAFIVFLSFFVILIGSFVTPDELLETSTTHWLALFIMAYTSYRGAKVYGWSFGLIFGFLLGVLVIVAFRMILLTPLFAFKVLEKEWESLVLKVARF